MDIKDRVFNIIIGADRPCQVDMESVSESLNMSSRSVRRKLFLDGYTFSRVKSLAIMHAIRRLILKNKNITAKQVCFEIGMSCDRNLTRLTVRSSGLKFSELKQVIGG